MATVTGITVARAQAIEDASVVSGHVTGGNLFLVTHGGEEVNAGQVVPNIPPVVAAWPIGSIFMTMVATNPAVLLGGGTWARWGQGRFPVSLVSGTSGSEEKFSSAGEIGGEAEHTLTVPELPSHSHGITDPTHNHDANFLSQQIDATLGGGVFVARPGSNVTVTGARSTGLSIQNTGSGAPHNNLPPYITCYMWQRTA